MARVRMGAKHAVSRSVQSAPVGVSTFFLCAIAVVLKCGLPSVALAQDEIPDPATVDVSNSDAAEQPVNQSSELRDRAPNPATDNSLGIFSDFGELDLAALLDIEVSVASSDKRSIRRSPGIVSLITREQILATGARDLTDILRLVPGLDLHLDVYGFVALSVRGVWAQEGKILLLLDGIPLSEHQYSANPVAWHIPVEQIERIEIIRGPGSVRYGGYAELGVISVITRSAKTAPGFSAHAKAGVFESAFGHAMGGVHYGWAVTDGIALRIAASSGYANASDGDYLDATGYGYNLVGNNYYRPSLFRIGAQWKDFELESHYDMYDTYQRDFFGQSVRLGTLPLYYRQGAVRVRYLWQAANRVELIPSFMYQVQQPWYTPGGRARSWLLDYSLAGSGAHSDRMNQRYTSGLLANLVLHDLLLIQVGAEHYLERHRDFTNTFFRGTGRETLHNAAGYGQLEFDWAWLSMIAGARYEWNSGSGAAFVPRLALSGAWQNLHAKLLGTQAFRTPSAYNLELQLGREPIRPEKTTAFETELGYQLIEGLNLTINGFWQQITDVIVFDVQGSNVGYNNLASTGSVGSEAQIQYRHTRASANLGYSFAKPWNNKVAIYQVGEPEKRLLGMVTHKFTVDGNVKPGLGFDIGPSLVLYGRRSGVTQNGSVQTYDPAVLLNFFVTYLVAGYDELSVGAGVYNITDNATPYVQPYNSGHPPMPGRGREFVLRVGYRL